MSLESFLDNQPRPVNYTKPCQLPTNVAFKLLKWEMESSKYEKKKTPKVTVMGDTYVDLAVWIGARHAHITDEQVKSMNQNIADGNNYYIVGRLFSKQEQVPIDVLTEQKKVVQGLEDFDPNVHSLRPIDKDGILIDGPPQTSTTPAKRQRTNE